MCLIGKKGRNFIPKRGRIYKHRNGGTYLCRWSTPFMDSNQAILQDTESKWLFVAHKCRIYRDGKIDWAYSTNGRFVK